jgi:aspartyl-tRNA(Asn)/glutamyl-tRNA(Gln) amidotransferase subunit C
MSDTRQPITEKDVLYVADLANLELTEDERARMVKDLNSILDYVDRLNELDTSNVEPMAQTSDRFGIDENKSGTARFAYAMREDKTGPSLPREVVMKNAPDSDGALFKVPKVIER